MKEQDDMLTGIGSNHFRGFHLNMTRGTTQTPNKRSVVANTHDWKTQVVHMRPAGSIVDPKALQRNENRSQLESSDLASAII